MAIVPKGAHRAALEEALDIVEHCWGEGAIERAENGIRAMIEAAKEKGG